jgi:hypothetical protein
MKKEPDAIQMGKQTWMKNNLGVATFRNGDTIPEAKTNEEWEQARFAEKPAWCYFKNDSANALKFGKLYNWYAVNDSRGLAPVGWHIPSDSEWTALCDNTGSKMFSIQRGGVRTFIGEFENVGIGFWWSGTGNEIYDMQYAWYRVVDSRNDSLRRHSYVKGSGFSVRCIKNAVH